MTGITQIDNINNYEVYIDPYLDDNTIMIGQKTNIQQQLVQKILDASNFITNAARTQGQYIVASSKVADILKDITITNERIRRDRRELRRKKLERIFKN